MTVIKKTAMADRSYGRGIDNYYTPARYNVINRHGEVVAQIIGSNASYMKSINWKIVWKGIVQKYYTRDFPSFKNAKQWAIENF